MYDELAKRLRERSVFLFPHHGESRSYDADLMHEAADAIEELSMKLHGANAAIYGMGREIERMVRTNAGNRWVSVDERLPEYEGFYITAFSKGDVGHNMYMKFADGSGKWYQNSEDTGPVTYWMKYPRPPLY